MNSDFSSLIEQAKLRENSNIIFRDWEEIFGFYLKRLKKSDSVLYNCIIAELYLSIYSNNKD